jgi:hypothetical protein
LILATISMKIACKYERKRNGKRFVNIKQFSSNSTFSAAASDSVEKLHIDTKN